MTSLVTNVVRGSNARRLMLLVHGYGADERDLGGLLQYLDPEGEYCVVLPRGPEAVPGTPGFAWYSWNPTGEFDPAAFTSSLDALDDLLDGLSRGRGEPLPPLEPGRPGRPGELATGVGERQS
jgi:predicted esterase